MIEKCTLVEPFSCKKTDKIKDVAKRLQEFMQRHIYVVDEDSRPVGIISVTDILNKVVIEGKSSDEMTAADTMNDKIFAFDDKDLVKDAYKMMSEKNIISVPVTEHGRFVGILTFKEAVKYVTDPKNIE